MTIKSFVHFFSKVVGSRVEATCGIFKGFALKNPRNSKQNLLTQILTAARVKNFQVFSTQIQAIADIKILCILIVSIALSNAYAREHKVHEHLQSP